MILSIIGYMGCGKSTVSRALYERLDRLPIDVQWIDLDHIIELQACNSIPILFEQKGEQAFRKLEHHCLKMIMSSQMTNKGLTILSCGGGTPLRLDNQALLKECDWVVWLDANPQCIWQRIHNSDRPLVKCITNECDIEEMMKQRESAYKAIATLKIKTDSHNVDQIVDVLVEQVSQKFDLTKTQSD